MADWGRNPAAPEFGRFGMVHVRYGKAVRGQPPRRRNVPSVMAWAVEAVADYVETWPMRPDRPCVRGGTRTEPLCATCTRSDAAFWTSYQALTSTERPGTVTAWLDKSAAPSITVTVAWQRASAGDWASYAAEVSRRDQKDGPS